MSIDRFSPVLLLSAVICLGLGVFLPIMEVRELVIFSNQFSIMEAAWQLLIEQQYLLGLVLIVFSVLFPFGKILATAIVWLRLQNNGRVSLIWISRVEFFGRWSCADVLLVALAVVVMKASGIAGATTEVGLWFFAASIPLTALATHRVKKSAMMA